MPTATILDGPLHRAGLRLGLVRDDTNSAPLGLAIGWSLWLLVMGVALVEGVAGRMLSLGWLGGHARVLIVIPLLFAAEAWFAPRVRVFVRGLTDLGLVAPVEGPRLALAVERLNRRSASWAPDVLALVAAVGVGLVGGRLQRYGASTSFDPARAEFQGTAAAWLYWTVVPLVFRFLVFRWIFRLGQWWRLLWQVSRLHLRLLPAHPDRTGGFGAIEGVQTRLLPLVAGLSVLEAASYAEELSRRTLSWDAIYLSVAIVVIVDLLLIVGPLVLFIPTLWSAHVTGMGQYRALATRYVEAFDRKWLGSEPAGEPLLGAPDLQSLADLGNSFGLVRDMRMVPVGPRLLTRLTMAALLPLAPLALFKYPVADLVKSLLARVAGL